MKWQKIQDGMDYVFLTFGMVFFMIVIHEFIHVIDGWNDNIAMCFGFMNAKRIGFVVNGDNYTLYQGEFWAYLVMFLLAVFIAVVWKKASDERRAKNG